MNKSERDIYQAYLLRIWREGGSSPGRAMLESTHTGNHHMEVRLFIFTLAPQIIPYYNANG